MADTLAARFAQRLELRDNPPPAPPLSQEPAAVQARLEDWLQAHYPQRNRRATPHRAQLLLALMHHPELTTQALIPLMGLLERATARTAQDLAALGLVARHARSGKHYHRLTHSAEDALLRVVAGP